MTFDERQKIIDNLGLTFDNRWMPSRLVYKGLPLGRTYSCWDDTYAIELFTERFRFKDGGEYDYRYVRIDTVKDFYEVFNTQTLPELKKTIEIKRLNKMKKDFENDD